MRIHTLRMVIGVNAVVYMTREQVEAHLLLHGWEPSYYGGIGAAVKYVAEPSHRRMWTFGCHWYFVYLVKQQPTPVYTRDCWVSPESATKWRRQETSSEAGGPWGHVGDDDHFCLLANRCLEEDREREL